MSDTATINPELPEDRHLARDLWETFNGNGDWWTCRFLLLCASSDHEHLAQLLRAYPREVEMYVEWQAMPQSDFARRWSIPQETPP